jgi:hypothetical protein
VAAAEEAREEAGVLGVALPESAIQAGRSRTAKEILRLPLRNLLCLTVVEGIKCRHAIGLGPKANLPGLTKRGIIDLE